MATEDLFIIAIELGSSKITGVGGKKLPDGSIQIEAVVQEPSSMFIRKGKIYNLDKSTQCIKSIIKRLEEQLKRTITQVYVGYGGKSLHSEHNSILKRFDAELPISKEIVDDLMKENLDTHSGDFDILEVIPQEFGVGSQKQIDPVGVLSNNIEGRYLNIMAHSSLRSNIDACFNNVGIHIVEDKLIPLVIADEILSDTEKRSGCVLVDFGADTTTVSVYKANLLRFLSVITLGSANITKDIMSCQLEESDAEELKLTHGCVATELTDEQGNATVYKLPDNTIITKAQLTEIIQARCEEILQNVKYQIETSKFGRESLMAGAWLTGCGANLKNISKAFTEVVGFDKVRIVKSPRQVVHLAKNIKNNDGQLLSVICLLAKGTQICTSSQYQEKTPAANIFEPTEESPAQQVEPTPPVTQEEEKKEVKEKKPKKSLFKNAVAKLKNFSDKIVGEE